jgi:peptidoglycan/xylan/chitin deacetylase (PgdA/CDA1 family)
MRMRKRIVLFVFSIFIIGSLCNFIPLAHASTKGTISLTFDDGVQNQYTNAYPIMQAHGVTGTFYVITSYLSDFSKNPTYMSLTELRTMQNSGNEIDSHTVDHYNLVTLTDAQINYECNMSQQTLRSNGFTANNFAYPDGGTNLHVDSIVSQYYKSARQAYPVYGGSFYMTLPIPQFSLPAYTVGQNGYNSDLPNLKNIIDQVAATGSYAIFTFHNIYSQTTTASIMSTQDFSSFLDYVASKGVATLTIDQATNVALTASVSNSQQAFGNSNIGAFSDSGPTGVKQAILYRLNDNNAAVNSIVWYGSVDSQSNMKCAIYSDNNGAPGTLLAQTQAVTVGTSNSWVTFPLASPVTLQSGSYWLSFIGTWPAASHINYNYDAGSSSQRARSAVQPFSQEFTTAFASVFAYDSHAVSIYATYTTK